MGWDDDDDGKLPSGDDDDVDVDVDRLLLVLIPGDVLIEILLCLPVVSLLRFKSVCKSWRALIESSFFIHLHATLPSSSSSKFGTFIFQCYNRTGIFMLSSSSSRSVRSGGDGSGEDDDDDDDDDDDEEVKDLGFPPFDEAVPHKEIAMVGSCNGLICLLWRGDVSLWNPATRQFKLLPKSLTLKEVEEVKKIGIRVYDVFEFGFDVKTKDFKVVKISSSSHRKVRRIVVRVQVYSLSNNSWRVLEEEEEGDGGINSLFPKQVQDLYLDNGVYLNGRSFFNGLYEIEDGFCQWVLSFDFTKEIFTNIQFPVNHGDFISYPCYYVGENKIATLSRRRRRGGGDDDDDDDDPSNLLVYDIWVLNIEHDDQENEEEEESYYWTKLQHSIQITRPKDMSCAPILPRFISNDGEFALIETRADGGNVGIEDWKLQLFNLVTKEERTVCPTGMGLLRAVVYKPSLVSIVGGGGNGNGAAAAAAAAVWGDLW